MKALQLHKPHLLVVVGLPGAGKTYFATHFSDTFNAPFINVAKYQSMLGNDDLAAQVVEETLDLLLKTNQTIIIEGIGARLAERRGLVTLAHKRGYEPFFVWVQTEPVTAELRAVRSKTSTMTKSEFETRMQEFENLQRSEPLTVISGKHTYASQAKMVLKKLVADRTELPPSAGPRPTGLRGRITIK